MGRSPCCDDKGLKKGPWTPEEDRKLLDYIHNHGHGSWRALPKLAGLNRCGKSCRLRWTNYLRPDIKRGKFSDEEEQIIIDLHSLLGNKWSRIAAHLPGRTDNEIKNQWNTHLRKKLLQRGIDPKTHKPLTDLNSLANLSQLLSSPSLGNLLMNPWDYYAFRSEVAQIQLLQSIVQLINPAPFHNIAESLLLGVGPPNNIAQFEGVSGGATTTIYNDTDHPQAPLDYPNLGLNGSQLFNNFPVGDNSVESIEGGFQVQPEDLGSNYDAQIENTLPALVSASVESSTVNQLERNINPMACPSPHSPTSNFFEGWEKFLDDEANAPWKDILS